MAVTSKVTLHNLDNCTSVQVEKRFLNSYCKDVTKMGNGGEERGVVGTTMGKGKMKNGNKTSL